jgi:hypothetical protein
LEKEKAVARVLNRIRRIQNESAPSTFMTSTPPMASPVFRGVVVADDPPLQAIGKQSFGQTRAAAMFKALEKSTAADNEEAFFQRLLEEMRAAGLDPAAPHRNLRPRGVR